MTRLGGLALLAVVISGYGCGDQAPPPPGAIPVEGRPEIRDLGSVSSALLGYSHQVRVYLPPGYGVGSHRYPVLYMLDGQHSFGGSKTLQLDQAATNLIRRYAIRPLIIVAIHSSDVPTQRGREYNPWDGTGVLFARMMAEELKPAIDAQFRTLPGPEDTGVMGSSLGGAMAWYMAIFHPGTFHLMAAQSGYISGKDTLILRTVRGLPSKLPLRLWYDRGTRDGEQKHRTLDSLMRRTLIDKGWTEGTDFRYMLVQEGTHSVRSWKQRNDSILKLLYAR